MHIICCHNETKTNIIKTRIATVVYEIANSPSLSLTLFINFMLHGYLRWRTLWLLLRNIYLGWGFRTIKSLWKYESEDYGNENKSLFPFYIKSSAISQFNKTVVQTWDCFSVVSVVVVFIFVCSLKHLFIHYKCFLYL